MMLKADAYASAYQDYVAAVSLTVTDAAALAGLVRTAVASHRQAEATSLLTSLAAQHPREPALRVALSKILAAQGRLDDAVVAAEQATNATPTNLPAWEQLASVFADAGDVNRLEPVVRVLERIGPDRASTAYYAAAAAYLSGQSEAALGFAQQAIARNAAYAAAENLIGAIHASRGEAEPARQAFNAALRLDAQDSATYANLGLLALSSHDAEEAFDRFAEALSLDPQSSVASTGLLQARALLSR